AWRAGALRRFVRYNGGRLDLHFGPLVDQRLYLDRRHRGKVPAHHVAIGDAEFALRGDIFTLVDDIPGHAHDVLRLPAGLAEHGDHVGERGLRLSYEVVRLELLAGVP